jgi:putative hydrolase of the HAD superfamily
MAAREVWHSFTISEVTPAYLSSKVGEILGTQIAQSVVIQAFNSELGPEISSTTKILPSLRTRTQVGCLSNTNSIHWDELLRSYSFMGEFDRRFASQLLGCAKPGREIYEKVVGLLRVKPHDILFFDDREENVLAARQLGWNARLYTNSDSLESDLREFSLV